MAMGRGPGGKDNRWQPAPGVAVLLVVLALVSVPALAQGLAGDLLLQAGRALEAEKWEDALKLYQQFVAQNPGHEGLPLAHFAAGECQFHLQRYEQALGSYRQVIEKHPDWSDADDGYFRAGNCLFQLGRYGEAAEILGQIAKKFPKSDIADKVAYWLGEAHYQAGAKAAAMAAYRESLEIAPQGEYAAYALYSIAMIERETDATATVATFNKLLDKFPDSPLAPDALYRLGESYQKLGKPKEATSHYQRVVTKYPDSEFAPHALAAVGQVQLAQKKFAEASETFLSVAERFPESPIAPDAGLQAADALFAAKDYAGAAALYAKAAADKDNPHAATARYFEGVAYQLDGGKGQQAIAAFEEFVKRHPDHALTAKAYVRLAAFHYVAGRFEEAVAAYEKVAELAGDDEELALSARYEAAWVAHEQEPTKETLAALASLITENPKTDMAARSSVTTARLALSEGQFGTALELAGVLLKDHPDHRKTAEALVVSGQAYRHLDQMAEAEATFSKVMTDYPDSAAASEARVGLTLVQMATGELEAAAKAIAQMEADGAAKARRPQLFCLLAEAHYERGNWQEAADAYVEAYQADKKSEWAGPALLGAGDARMAAKKYETAALAYKHFLKEFPEATQRAQARVQFGVALARMGKHADAAEQFEQALAAEPEAQWVAEVLFELADTYAEGNKPLAAAETYLKLAEQYPQHELAADALFWAGELRYKQGNFAVAAELYGRLLDDYEGSELADEAHYKLAWALLKSDKSGEALEHFLKAAETADEPQVAFDARLRAGYILMQQDEYERAVATLEPGAEAAAPEQLPALLHLLGQAYLGNSQPDKAVVLLLRALEEFPKSPYTPRTRLVLARAHKELEHFDQATAMLAGLVESEDATLRAEARFEVAELSRLQNELAEAAKLYLRVAEDKAPRELAASALYAAGLCYEKAGRVSPAREVYRGLIADYAGETEWTKRAQERLDALSGTP